MPFGATDKVAVGVGLEREGPERDALIDLDAAADLTGFADHDAGAMINEKMVADRCAGMDVDAGAGVRPLRHHPGNQRHLQPVQDMGEPMDRHRFEAGIAEDDLVEGPYGGVAVVGRLDVGREHLSQLGDPLEKLDRLGLPEGLEVGVLRAVPHGIRHGRYLNALFQGGPLHREAVPQSPPDLDGEFVVEAVDQVAHVVGDIAEVEVFAAAIAGIEDILEILADRDDRLVVGQRAVTEVVDRGDILVRLDDPPRQFRQLLLDP